MRIARRLVALGIFGGLLACLVDTTANGAEARSAKRTPKSENGLPLRSVPGLQVLYDFRSAKGDVVTDRSGVGKPLNLRITDPKAVRRSSGGLEVRGKTRIESAQPATKIIEAVRRSGEITIEAWVRPADTRLTGPARIVTLSRNSNERNLTLGQQGDQYDVRFRTTTTNANGIPSMSTKKGSLKTGLTHVVYTRDRSGRTRLCINGRPRIEMTISGSTSKWIGSHKLALANEFGGDRLWKGTYYLVAIYSRDLSPSDVKRLFEAGPEANEAPAELARSPRQPHSAGAALFENKIAALLANHCLECHDTATKKGGLDLSRKQPALAGGDSGSAITPGDPADSLIWQYVDSDEMPVDRPALSANEKELLREWIDAGATWSLDLIDPVAYEHGHRATENWIRRLTVSEYIETVRAAMGVDIAKDARRLLPLDVRADGFSNTAYNLTVDLKHVNAYAQLAEIIVGRVDVARFARRFSKSRKLTDKDMRSLIAKMGKWLLRGPLQEHEIVDYRGITTTVVSAGGDFDEAVGWVIQAMLQSPRFIYRVENQRGNGTTWQVGDYELASRLSYIIWGGPPDEELVRAADAGQLHDRSKVRAQAQRMLKDPRAVARSKQFLYEWLDLDRMQNMRPNPKRFPQWTGQLARDMRDETLAVFKEVVWDQQRPLSDLLNAQFTYASPRLAKHYGLRAKGKGVSRYDLSDVPSRGGLLTHGSVLTVGGDDASMVTRGLFVLHDLLRGSVRDPPPSVDTTPQPTKRGLSQRGIAEARIANASCGRCHVKFEPLAFGLEKFDGIGAFHNEDEHGNKLRDDGKILFPGSAKPVPYKSSAELMDLLATNERVRESITWKLTQFAVGRPLGAADAPILEQIHEAARKGGGTYVSLMTAIVASDLVQMTRTEYTR